MRGLSLETFLPLAALHGAKTQSRAVTRNTTNLDSVTFRVLIQRRKEQAVAITNQDRKASAEYSSY